MQAEDWLSGRGAVIRRVVSGARLGSLTMLKTTVDVTEFTSPWSMRPFPHRGVGKVWMRSLNRPVFRFLMRLQGIGDRSPVSAAEFGTFLTPMKGPGRGRAFLQISGGKHFPQEDQAPAIARKIAEQALRHSSRARR
jgi:hypothetical protein